MIRRWDGWVGPWANRKISSESLETGVAQLRNHKLQTSRRRTARAKSMGSNTKIREE